MFKRPNLVDVDRYVCKSLREYVEIAWPYVEPRRPFMSNWHIDAVCDHLGAVSRHDITRLVINIPPGSSKSLLCGVFWPTWAWTSDPATKWITASYSGLVARRDSLRALRLLQTQWWRDRWGGEWKFNPDECGALKYSNTLAGFRLAVTVAGGVTGEHADHQLVDDPIKPLDARGGHVDSAKLRAVIEWWDETMTSRVVDPATSTRTIIMQRLHENDLAGHVLKSGDYTHLCLPMRYEPRCCVTVSHPCSMREDGKGDPAPPTPCGYKDQRAEGALLWPARFPEAIQKMRHKELGSRGVAAQDQQRPVPSGGGIFKRDWIKFWRVLPKGKPGTLIQSWDCAFKDLDTSDDVAGQTWLAMDGCYYLVDRVCDQMGLGATCRAILSMSAKHPKAIRKLIEDKANGPAVIETMRKQVPGLLAVNPQGGKVARANAVEPIWESGNVFIPDPTIAPWVHDFIEQVISFNGDAGRRDDEVDAMTQALSYLHRRTVATYKKAIEQWPV